MIKNPMLYKTLVVGVILLLLCLSITPSVAIDSVKKSTYPISSGNTLYVGGTGPGNYSKIQDAIDNASDGDTVFVYNGIYYENVIIKGKSIKLIGEETNSTIIDEGGDITPWSYALKAYHTDGSIVCNLTLQNSTTIHGSDFAFYASGSDNLKIINCRIRDSGEGMAFNSCGNIYMRNNRIENNTMNFQISNCYKLSHVYNDIDTSNTINGKPIYYIINESYMVFDGVDIGWLGLVNCTNITVKNIVIIGNYQNIFLIDTCDSIISNCILYNSKLNSIGIGWNSDNNIIENCPILEGVSLISNNEKIPNYNKIIDCNLTFAVHFQGANYNSVENCSIDLSLGKGGVDWHISLSGCHYNTISNCSIFNGGTRNYIACFLDGYGGCSYNSIFNNTFNNFSWAAIELSENSDNNIIIGNHIVNCNNVDFRAGIYIREPYHGSSDNNIIYHNNFIKNKNNAYDGGNNTWDNDYPSGGNFWDDYTGNDSDGDGIGDTSYTIPGGDNMDRYPLMAPTFNFPPDTPVIDGPKSGKPRIEYNFTFKSTDLEGDPVMYYIDWGDNDIEWTEYSDSGVEITLKHSWNKKGNYRIRAMAKDIHHDASEISEFYVTIPRTRANIYQWLLERFPLLERLLSFLLL